MPTSLGLVGIVNKGDYNPATTYVKGNFVYYNYSTWLCKVASATGIEPKAENSTTWQPLAMGINVATFTGATASTAGTGGAVPAPQAGDEGKALMGDGTWDYAGELSWTGTTEEWNALSVSEKAQYAGKKVYITDDYIQNIPVMIGASANDDGYKGIVPTPHAGQQKSLLRGDGTWGADENLAPPYSSSSTYTKGELCTNQGKLWKCKTAINTAHAWNASEWDEVTTSEAFLPQYELVNTYTSQSTDTWGDIIRSLCNVDLTPYSDAKIVLIANGLPAIIANVSAIQSNANRFSSISGTATGGIEVLCLSCFTTDNRGVVSKLIANSTNGVTYTNLSDIVANYNFEWKLYARR